MRFAAITGTSRGLGQALAARFRNAGWDVQHLNRPAFDLSRWTEIDERLFPPARTAGVIEAILINNAQSMRVGAVADVHSADLTANLAANVLGQIALAKAFATAFPKGRIVNISSGAARRPIAGWASYCSSKAAVQMFFDVMKLEGHDVVSIDPGLIDTDMQAQIRSSDFPDRDKFVAAHSEGRLKSPAQVADTIYEAALAN